MLGVIPFRQSNWLRVIDGVESNLIKLGVIGIRLKYVKNMYICVIFLFCFGFQIVCAISVNTEDRPRVY